MSIRATWDVFCDAPDCLQWCVDASSATPKRAREAAQRAGWKRIGGVGDVCPRHPEYGGSPTRMTPFGEVPR